MKIEMEGNVAYQLQSQNPHFHSENPPPVLYEVVNYIRACALPAICNDVTYVGGVAPRWSGVGVE